MRTSQVTSALLLLATGAAAMALIVLFRERAQPSASPGDDTREKRSSVVSQQRGNGLGDSASGFLSSFASWRNGGGEGANGDVGDGGRRSFTWSIFITPQGFVGAADRRQRRAIESWIRLKPKPQVVLVGKGEGYEEVARDYGLVIDERLDMNFVKMPLAGSLVDTAIRSDSDISVILNSDIMLSQSFANALLKLHGTFTDWFMAGARYDVKDLPAAFEPYRDDFDDSAFVSYAKTKGFLHTAGGQDYFAWNNNGKRLMHGTMPPFIRGKSKFDNWFVHEVIQAGYRDVIDATEAVVAVHVDHDYTSAQGDVVAAQSGSKSTFWMSKKSEDWQIFHNNHLAAQYGSYRNQDGTTRHAPWKLSACMEPSGICLIKRVRPGVCPCEHNAMALSTQNDPEVVEVFEDDVKKRVVKCAGISIDRPKAYDIPTKTSEGHAPIFGLPFTLKDLLPLVAKDKLVIVTGASYAYRDVVINFVCNLRRLGIYDQLVIAAFDEDMYRYGFRMGLPVFYYEGNNLAGLTARDLEYGSNGFKSVTKLKSQVVLQVLRAGYDAIWTDTDIMWFKNPLPALDAMESDFVVQSNAPWPEERAANGPLRINSGFYRIRSTPIAIEALEKIISHAATSTLTEQPSFYIILCGGRDGQSTVGPDKCVFESSAPAFDGDPRTQPVHHLEVEFLNRQLFPNGAVGKFWQVADPHKEFPQVMILHNNWIKGIRAKIARVIDKKLWFYDREKEICNYELRPTFRFNWSLDDGGEE